MNDFTKEELQLIYDDLNDNYSELKNIPLINKVKQMIDNYCEHEPSEPRLVLVKNCINCARHLETRPWGNEVVFS
jgi:hypothetical protein